MHLLEFEGKRPVVGPDAFVAATATHGRQRDGGADTLGPIRCCGDVTVEAGASIWYGVVGRAGIRTVVIRAGSNVQDDSVLHAAPGETLVVGPEATVGHGCVVHGASVGERARIGDGATLPDYATVGDRTLLAAGSVVTPGTAIPGGVMAAGTPARATRPMEGTSSEPWVETNADHYREPATRHAAAAVELPAAQL